MPALLDVSTLIAAAVGTHQSHTVVNQWLAAQQEFFTCPLVQTSFVRVTMGASFGLIFVEAQRLLAQWTASARHRFVTDDVFASELPVLLGNKEVTDAHLVTLARKHGLKLATLDKPLCTKPWAQGIAEYIGP